MNQVYICADFGSDGAENIKKATQYAGFVYGHDMIPIAPAMYSGALNLSKPKDQHRMRETRKCKLWNGSQLWVFGSRITQEMREEIRSFQALNGANAKIRYVSDAELESFYSRRRPRGRKFRPANKSQGGKKKVSHNFHRRKNRHDNKTAEAV